MRIQLVSPLGIIEKGSQAIQGDSFYPHLDDVSASDNVFVLCDGLGGHVHSEVASSVVAKSMGEWLKKNLDLSTQPTGLTIRKAVVNAQSHLDETYCRFGPSRYPMGTTMAMLAIGNFGAVAAHIGDTRIYHIRPSRREILYRSRDHSLVNDLFLAGRLTRAEAEASTKKNVLSRAMLPSPSAAAVPDVAFITDIETGDYFVLCSDGITQAVSDKVLKDVLCNPQFSNAQKVASLKLHTDAVTANHSLMLIEVKSVEKDSGDHLLVNTERLMCDKMVRRSVMLAPTATVVSPSAVGTPVEAMPPVNDEIGEGESVVEPIQPTDATIKSAVATCEALSEPLPQQQQMAALPTTQNVEPKNKKSSNSLFWIILAVLLLSIAIASLMLFNKKDGDNEASEKSKTEQSDPDVIISKDVPNDVLPDEPLEPFDSTGEAMSSTGSNVAVTPAPTVTDLPTPSSRYDTGSNVNVPRVKEGDPYPDAFDNKDDYKELEKEVPVTSVDDKEVPAQPTQQKPGGVPPPRKKVSNDPSASNRNVAVPPPPSKKH